MKKRFLTFILTIATMLMCIFGFSACGGNVEFKINFVVENEVYATVSTSGNEVISMPENPTKDDYTFDGWYWDEDTWEKPFTANSLLDAPLSSDMKVYAKFNKNHTHEYTPTTTEPTCTEKGIITYTCTCGDSYTEDIPAIGHDEKTHQAKAPTCTEIGWEEYVTCEREGCEYSTYKEIPATGEHTWDDGKVTTEPTCTEKGVKTFTCTVCETTTYTEDVEALTHDEKTHQAKAPTCTEIGWEEYVTCEREGCEYSTYKEIPATGVHTWDKGEETKAPTCTKEGEMTYTCTVCKTTTKTEPIDKLPHEHNTEKWTSNATYHWHECVCGDKKGEEKHTAGAPATATTPQTCTVCGYVLQVETGILFNTLTVDGTKVYGKVSNTTTEFSFINEVTVKGNATYVVDNDKDCGSPIYSKTVDLKIGDNTFYVLEMIGNDVKLFTVTIRRRPMYEVTFNANGGTAVEKQVIEEDYLATEPETTRTGYTFTGWNYDFATPITQTTKITASWSANKDTKYTVNYYLQNLDDNNYTLHETVELTGETDTTATAEIKEYTHFTYNESASTISGNINPEGNRVLSVYYTRDSYKIVANNNNAKAGTSTQVNGEYKYDKQFTLTATTNAGYTWLGWCDGETLACEDEEFTFKAEKDVTYTATWSTNVYNITYELNDGENHENNPNTYTIETATITLQTPTRTGYTFGGWFAEETFENKVTKIALGSYGEKTFYAKWTPTEYTITYHHNDVIRNEITSNSYNITNNSSSTWTENNGVLKSTNKTDSSSSVYKIVANENIIVSFEYKVSSEKNYDKLIIAKNDTALETVSGSTSYVAYSVTLNVGEYLTFTYSKDVSQKSGDDCAYIKNLTYAPNGKVEQVTTQTYNIETPTFDLITPTRAGYTFNGWFIEETFENQVTEIPVGSYGDKVYYASWSANTDTKYTVIYYWQNVEDDNYTSHESVELEGETDTTATADIKEYTHFTYNASKSVISGNIDGDGSRILSVYYTRDKYVISTARNNTKAGTVTAGGTYKFDKQITLTAQTNAGYTWLGWYDGETLACATEEFTFKAEKDVTYTATWSANTDTKYTVIYYLQNLDDDNYTLHESVELEGETDTTATADIKEYTHFTYNASKSTISGNINGDGGQVLSVYYTRNMYSLSIDNTTAGIITNSGNYKYGNQEIISEIVTYLGYEFIGWYSGEELLSTDTTYTFTVDKNVTAKFAVKEEMSNFNFTSTATACSITGIKNKTVTEIVVPDYVTSISQGSFNGCSSLESITIPFVGDSRKTASNTYQYPFGYIFGTSSYTGGTGVKQYYYGSSTSSTTYSTYYIPTSLKKVTVTGGNILRGAFQFCNSLTSVEIPDSVTSIGSSAFSNCSRLTSIEIPDSVTSIGDYAFANCSRLTSIVIGDSVTSIGNYAFYYCSSLTSVVIGDSVTSIGNYAFAGCSSLTSVVIGGSVTSIGGYAFYECSSLTSVVIGDSVTSIGSMAFYDCNSLTSIKYRGTQEQWQTISKGGSWNDNTGSYTITYNYKD